MGLQLPSRLLVRADVAGPYRHEQCADLSGLSVLAELGAQDSLQDWTVT